MPRVYKRLPGTRLYGTHTRYTAEHLEDALAEIRQVEPQQNTVTRLSSQSSVTIPFERTFRNLDVPTVGDAAVSAFNFCGCGWPENLLIPKGTPEGMQAVLFVMVSDYQTDRVDQPAARSGSDNGVSYCGLRGGKYPDSKPMGWPLDRIPRTNIDTIQQFLTQNMMIQDVTIKFENRIEPPSVERSIKAGVPSQPAAARKPAVINRSEPEKPLANRSEPEKPVEKKEVKKQSSVQYGSEAEEEYEEEYE